VTTFCLTYGTATLQIPRTTMLLAAIIAAVVLGLTTILSAHVSDRLGRKRISLLAAVLSIVWAFPLFWLIQTRDPVLITVAMSGGLFCMGMLYGPMGAFLPELFRVRYRYSGASFAYSAAGIVGGGISPLIATGLLASTGSTAAVSWFLIVVALICVASTAALGDTLNHDFTDGLGLAPAAEGAGNG
jgi:nitrate/nitrite transporter NarK